MKYQKNYWKSALRVGMTAAALAASASSPAFAESRTAVDEVSLTIESEITGGSYSSDVAVDSDNTDVYEVSDVEVIGDGKKWQEGDRPRVKITLEVTDTEEYYFPSGSSSMFQFSDDDAEYVTSSRSDNNTVLTVTVKLGEIPAGEDEDDEDSSDDDEDEDDDDDGAYGSKSDWLNGTGVYKSEEKTSTDSSDDDSSDKDSDDEDSDSETDSRKVVGDDSDNGPGVSGSSASASSSSSASRATVGPAGSSSETESSSSNYSSVTATSGGSSDSSSGTNTTWDSPQTQTGGSGWQSDSVGWWYRNADGSYPKSTWLQISGIWYYFDDSGYLLSGWIQNGDKWYYCGEDGAMLVNAKTPDGYYVGGDGVWIQ